MIKQRTIKEAVSIEGVGLQTGKKVRLVLKSAPADSGINFVRTDLAARPVLNINSLDLSRSANYEQRTILGAGSVEIHTTEHLMAALSGLSVDNATVEIDNLELPGLDGSAKGYVDAIRKAGVTEQGAPKKIMKIDKPVWCETDGSFLAVFPDDKFRISYTLSYRAPSLGTQFLNIVIDEKSFEKEIAPARTFCLEEEAPALLKMGLGKGAGYDNTLVIGKAGPIKNSFRFPDEPVRHKILDLVGDLYLAGGPIFGHVVAIKSGHRLNMELVKLLKRR